MNRALTLLAALSCVLSGCSKPATESSTGAPSTPPNIILLYADDQGWPGLSVAMDPDRADSKSDYYQTPNLDRLSTRGIVFTRSYAGSPVCSASRASVQTGLSTARHGMTALAGWNPRSGDSHLLQRTPNKCNDISELTTLPEALKLVDASYRTAHFGKWHLHSGGPSRNGFDVSDGPTINTEGDVSDPDPKLTFSISESGIGFMRECAEQERPFFLQLSYYAVHLELHALDATLAKYEALPGGDKHANPLYAAMTEDLDTGVGRVLDAIDKLDLQDNTYVIYASDNGAYVNLNQVRVQGEISSCEPLRNGKFWLYEGGLRVPMIVSGPGIARGAYSRNVVSQTDLYPTFVELAGGKPADTLDGVSIRRLFADPDGPKIERRDDALFFHYPHYNRQATPHSSIVDGDMKLIKFWEDGALQMFDLSVDLEESVNLAEAQSELAASMEARLQRYLEQVDALLPKRK